MKQAISDQDSPVRSVADAQVYLGKISRATLYSLLPQLETIKLGGRRLIVKSSMDALLLRSRIAPTGPASKNGAASQP